MKILTLPLAALLAACAAHPTSPYTTYVTPAAAPPSAYQAGYNDGCVSGRSAGGNVTLPFTKDVARAQGDSLYAGGWDDGFRVCKGQTEAIVRSLGR